MRKITIFLVWAVWLVASTTHAQAPQKMSYQAVVRNASGNLVTGVPVGVRISLIKDTPTGTTVYSETHNAFANSNGLITFEIGGGSVVSGNFGSINWGSGLYFVKTETDPAGGSNYTVVGTSQLLSVPYAMYAAKSGSGGGKTSIYLVNDITDAQAQAKIAAELGPDTENIYITGTTELTTVDLSGAVSLTNLVIEDNAVLGSVNLGDLKTAFERFSIASNPQLSSVSLPAFESSMKDFRVSTNESLAGLAMPNLTKIFGSFQIDENDAMSAFTTPSLNKINGTFTVYENNALTSYAIPSATIVKGNMSFRQNDALANLDLSGVQYCSNDIGISWNAVLNSVDCSGLTLVGSIAFYDNVNLAQISINNLTAGGLSISNTKLTSFSFPNYVSGNFYVAQNPLLTTISLPAYTTAPNAFAINSNPNLATVSFPMFTNITYFDPNYYVSLGLKTNHFSSTQVNALLHHFLSMNPPGNKIIDLRQSPAAPPTGQGILDKQALVAAGNIIYTD